MSKKVECRVAKNEKAHFSEAIKEEFVIPEVAATSRGKLTTSETFL